MSPLPRLIAQSAGADPRSGKALAAAYVAAARESRRIGARIAAARYLNHAATCRQLALGGTK